MTSGQSKLSNFGIISAKLHVISYVLIEQAIVASQSVILFHLFIS